MRNPDLWSRIASELSDTAIKSAVDWADLLRRADWRAAYGTRVADELRRVVYLSALPGKSVVPPLPVAFLRDELHSTAPELLRVGGALPPKAREGFDSYSEGRALYALEFAAAPPSDIWHNSPPAEVEAWIARRAETRANAPKARRLGLIMMGFFLAIYASLQVVASGMSPDAAADIPSGPFLWLAFLMAGFALFGHWLARGRADTTRLAAFGVAAQQVYHRSESAGGGGSDSAWDGGGDGAGGGD